MAGKRRRVSNPLALAVLATLRERPMHPYEMAATMRAQGKERSIKLNYGSLYTVVDNLAKHGLIEAMEASREGRRPERTVYRLTDPGRTELEDWLTELLGTPVKEYPQFEAALAEIGGAHPGPGTRRPRAPGASPGAGARAGTGRDRPADLAASPVPDRERVPPGHEDAELAWVRGLVRELRDGSFPLMKEWDHWTRTGEFPPGLADELYEAGGRYAPVEGAPRRQSGRSWRGAGRPRPRDAPIPIPIAAPARSAEGSR